MYIFACTENSKLWLWPCLLGFDWLCGADGSVDAVPARNGSLTSATATATARPGYKRVQAKESDFDICSCQDFGESDGDSDDDDDQPGQKRARKSGESPGF